MTERQRKAIVKYIINHPLFLGKYGIEEGGIVDFLELIWNLRKMPSLDGGFPSAYEDAWQHLVRNHDWDYEYLFLVRLSDTYKKIDVFNKFVSFCVHPSLFNDEKKRKKFVDDINRELIKVGYKLMGTDYFEQHIVYSIVPKAENNQMLDDIWHNSIPIYYKQSAPRDYPCMELVANSWDDWFTYKTKFALVYYSAPDKECEIGFLKLMKRNNKETASVLPSTFFGLTDDWCSIGMDYSYYENIKEKFKSSYQSVLYALRDTAMFPSIYESFENDPCFNNSLIRQEPYNSNPAPLLDSVRWRLQGVNVENYYKFKYSFIPYYSKDVEQNYTTLDFDFVYDIPFEQRIYGIIGKNGSGKTTMLSKMAQSFQSASDKRIMPRKPLYNKVISISFSIFDTFPLPKGDARFNYKYLGIRDKQGDNILAKIRTELRNHLNGINAKSRMPQWFFFLKDVLHEQLAGILTHEELYEEIDVDKVMDYMEKLSSGENLLIYIFSSLLDEIKQNTLILFDEPEMHLHPNAISCLIQYMYRLLEHFNSFCIMATHSPLVIQEIPSDNVIIFRRDGDSLTVQPLTFETFSQDLSTVTEGVFGDTSTNRYHYKKLCDMVKHIKNYDIILKYLSNSGRPVPLGTRMLLKSMLKKFNA